MSAVPTPEPLPIPEPAKTPAADPGLGALTVADLANRADKAFAEHTEGYTASTVLHRMYMDETRREETRRDEASWDALDLVLLRLEAYHTATRSAWRQAYNAWAAAAGAELDPDAADGHAGETAEPPSDDLPVYDVTAHLFIDIDDGCATDTEF